jgi:purine-binding chemotaxis protein CheW
MPDMYRGEANQYLIFRIGDEEFGCEVSAVREVIRAQRITRVPHSRHAIAGVINYRGDLKPVMDLGEKLGLPPVEITPETRFVVIDAECGGYCFMVDQVTRTMTIDSTSIEPPSSLAIGTEAEYITGIAKLETGLVILIDLALLAMDLCDLPMADATA